MAELAGEKWEKENGRDAGFLFFVFILFLILLFFDDVVGIYGGLFMDFMCTFIYIY